MTTTKSAGSADNLQPQAAAGPRFLGNWSLAVQIVVFSVGGFALIMVASDHTKDSAAFSDTPRFKVWLMLMATQVATWPIVFRVGRDRISDIKKYTADRCRWHDAVLLVLVGLAVAAAFLPALLGWRVSGDALWGHTVRIGIAATGGLIAASPCFIVIWRIHHALAQDVTDTKSAQAMIERIRTLRPPLIAALAAVGVLVTEVTLTTGALRNALIEWQPTRAATFPGELVLIYGAFFTALLAAAAIPTYGRMNRRATKVVDTLLQILTPPEKEWRDRLEARRDLATIVHADTNLFQSFQATVLVTGPLLTGLLSLLVPSN